jgi:hypothetical protein
MFIAAAIGCTPSEVAQSRCQKRADAREWRWADNEAKLLYSVRHHLKGYQVQVIRPENNDDPRGPLTVRVLDKGQEVCSFSAHDETVFTQLGDVVFVADFSPMATGCTIVAYDLKARRQLWQCPLKGNPPQAHSEYRHQVNITVDDDAVLVYGNESNGRYIEYVDAKTGITVGHKKLLPER